MCDTCYTPWQEHALCNALGAGAACGGAPADFPSAATEPGTCYACDDEPTCASCPSTATLEREVGEVICEPCTGAFWWKECSHAKTQCCTPHDCSRTAYDCNCVTYDCPCGNVAHSELGQLRVRYEVAAPQGSEGCAAVEQTQGRLCDNGVFTGGFVYAEGAGGNAATAADLFSVATCFEPCPLPDGSYVPHGTLQSRERWRTAAPAFEAGCEAETQTRVCHNGAMTDWSGSYAATECQPACASGVRFAEEQTATQFTEATLRHGLSCASAAAAVMRTCGQKATFGEWFEADGGGLCAGGCFERCRVDCPVPNFAGVDVGADERYGEAAVVSAFRFRFASVAPGGACVGATVQKVCASPMGVGNGASLQWEPSHPDVWSDPLFSAASCGVRCVGAAGEELEHGTTETRTMFSTSAVGTEQSCLAYAQAQARRCENGTMSEWRVADTDQPIVDGAFAFDECTRGCTDGIQSGYNQTRIMFASNRVSPLAACANQTQSRTCRDGSFGAWSVVGASGATEPLYEHDTCAIRCAVGCDPSMVGDGTPDAACLTAECCFDGGDFALLLLSHVSQARAAALRGDSAEAVSMAEAACNTSSFAASGEVVDRRLLELSSAACALRNNLLQNRDPFGLAAGAVTPASWTSYMALFEARVDETKAYEEDLANVRAELATFQVSLAQQELSEQVDELKEALLTAINSRFSELNAGLEALSGEVTSNGATLDDLRETTRDTHAAVLATYALQLTHQDIALENGRLILQNGRTFADGLRSVAVDLKAEIAAGNAALFDELGEITADIDEVKGIIVEGNTLILQTIENEALITRQLTRLGLEGLSMQLSAMEGRLSAQMSDMEDALMDELAIVRTQIAGLYERIDALTARLNSTGWDTNGDGNIATAEMLALAVETGRMTSVGGGVMEAFADAGGALSDGRRRLTQLIDMNGFARIAGDILSRALHHAPSSLFEPGTWDADGDGAIGERDVLTVLRNWGQIEDDFVGLWDTLTTPEHLLSLGLEDLLGAVSWEEVAALAEEHLGVQVNVTALVSTLTRTIRLTADGEGGWDLDLDQRAAASEIVALLRDSGRLPAWMAVVFDTLQVALDAEGEGGLLPVLRTAATQWAPRARGLVIAELESRLPADLSDKVIAFLGGETVTIDVQLHGLELSVNVSKQILADVRGWDILGDGAVDQEEVVAIIDALGISATAVDGELIVAASNLLWDLAIESDALVVTGDTAARMGGILLDRLLPQLEALAAPLGDLARLEAERLLNVSLPDDLIDDVRAFLAGQVVNVTVTLKGQAQTLQASKQSLQNILSWDLRMDGTVDHEEIFAILCAFGIVPEGVKQYWSLAVDAVEDFSDGIEWTEALQLAAQIFNAAEIGGEVGGIIGEGLDLAIELAQGIVDQDALLLYVTERIRINGWSVAGVLGQHNISTVDLLDFLSAIGAAKGATTSQLLTTFSALLGRHGHLLGGQEVQEFIARAQGIVGACLDDPWCQDVLDDPSALLTAEGWDWNGDGVLDERDLIGAIESFQLLPPKTSALISRVAANARSVYAAAVSCLEEQGGDGQVDASEMLCLVETIPWDAVWNTVEDIFGPVEDWVIGKVVLDLTQAVGTLAGCVLTTTDAVVDLSATLGELLGDGAAVLAQCGAAASVFAGNLVGLLAVPGCISGAISFVSDLVSAMPGIMENVNAIGTSIKKAWGAVKSFFGGNSKRRGLLQSQLPGQGLATEGLLAELDLVVGDADALGAAWLGNLQASVDMSEADALSLNASLPAVSAAVPVERLAVYTGQVGGLLGNRGFAPLVGTAIDLSVESAEARRGWQEAAARYQTLLEEAQSLQARGQAQADSAQCIASAASGDEPGAVEKRVRTHLIGLLQHHVSSAVHSAMRALAQYRRQFEYAALRPSMVSGTLPAECTPALTAGNSDSFPLLGASCSSALRSRVAALSAELIDAAIELGRPEQSLSVAFDAIEGVHYGAATGTALLVGGALTIDLPAPKVPSRFVGVRVLSVGAYLSPPPTDATGQVALVIRKGPRSLFFDAGGGLHSFTHPRPNAYSFRYDVESCVALTGDAGGATFGEHISYSPYGSWTLAPTGDGGDAYAAAAAAARGVRFVFDIAFAAERSDAAAGLFAHDLRHPTDVEVVSGQGAGCAVMAPPPGRSTPPAPVTSAPLPPPPPALQWSDTYAVLEVETAQASGANANVFTATGSKALLEAILASALRVDEVLVATQALSPSVTRIEVRVRIASDADEDSAKELLSGLEDAGALSLVQSTLTELNATISYVGIEATHDEKGGREGPWPWYGVLLLVLAVAAVGVAGVLTWRKRDKLRARLKRLDTATRHRLSRLSFVMEQIEAGDAAGKPHNMPDASAGESGPRDVSASVSSVGTNSTRENREFSIMMASDLASEDGGAMGVLAQMANPAYSGDVETIGKAQTPRGSRSASLVSEDGSGRV